MFAGRVATGLLLALGAEAEAGLPVRIPPGHLGSRLRVLSRSAGVQLPASVPGSGRSAVHRDIRAQLGLGLLLRPLATRVVDGLG